MLSPSRIALGNLWGYGARCARRRKILTTLKIKKYYIQLKKKKKKKNYGATSRDDGGVKVALAFLETQSNHSKLAKTFMNKAFKARAPRVQGAMDAARISSIKQ